MYSIAQNKILLQNTFLEAYLKFMEPDTFVFCTMWIYGESSNYLMLLDLQSINGVKIGHTHSVEDIYPVGVCICVSYV